MSRIEDKASLDDTRSGIWPAILLYAAAGMLCLLAEILLFQLWKADLRVPFYYPLGSDVLHNLLVTKNITETGYFLSFPRVGAPGTLDHHDYTTLEYAHLFTIKLIATVTGDAGVTFNLFYLGSFFLITWASLFAMRQLGVSRSVAVVASLLYAFLPYHMLRGQYHIFLMPYYAIPLIVLAMLRICEGKPLFFGWGPGGVRWRVVAFSLVAGVLVAGSGVYTAAFSLYFLSLAALIGFSRQWRPARLADGLAVMALIVAVVLAQAMPSVLYNRAHGKNTTALRREAWESEHYALSFSTMLRPLPYHRFVNLAKSALGRDQGSNKAGNLRDFINGDERQFVVLGAFGTVGLLALLVVPFLVRRPPGTPPLLDPLWKLCLAGVLLGVPGGVGYLIAVYVSPNLRSLNRVSIFIGYFCILATALLLDLVRRRAASPGRRSLFNAALGAVLVLGLLDQVPEFLVPEYDNAKAIFARDREFYTRVEAALPPGSMVFLLPYAEFPDGFPDTHTFGGGVDLRVIPSLAKAEDIPAEGKALVVVASVNDMLHFRIFDYDGKMVVDTDEKKLAEKSRQVEEIKKQLDRLRQLRELDSSDKEQFIRVVTGLVGYSFYGSRRGDEHIRPRLYTVHELIRPFLHTERLRFASPMMRGRGSYAWFSRFKKMPVGRMVEELSQAGFGGISVDRGGYDDKAVAVVDGLRQALGPETLESPDHRFVFFPLKPAHPPAAVAGPR